MTFKWVDGKGPVRTSCWRCKEYSEELIEAICPKCRIEIKYLKKKEQKAERERIAKERGSRHIPTHIKDSVWCRDNGKCVQCGSSKFVEYHHIKEFSKGGEHTIENIQLKCYLCHRIDPNMELFKRSV